MITALLIGFGIGLILVGIIMGGLEGNVKYLIISSIGIILIIISLTIITNATIDCQNYCQCKGKYHYYDLTKDVCECLDTSKVATDCFNKCEGSAQYNSKTGRCYCT